MLVSAVNGRSDMNNLFSSYHLPTLPSSTNVLVISQVTLFKKNDVTLTFFDFSGSCRTRTSRSDCCVFPFIYHGRRYNSCTKVRSRRPWCSLTSSYDKDKLYGYCGGTKREISFLTGS